jgi:hypothetical protein
MKIAIHNCYFKKNYAETELSRRISLAAQHIGWEAVEFGNSEDIKQYDPDFVLALHFRTPKLTPYPTYGCLWHPLVFVETESEFIRNILSYDGFLSSSITTDQWIKDRLYNTPKKHFIAPFFTSCNRTTYQKPVLDTPHIAYIGTNWDGERYKELFLGLEAQNCSRIYGSQAGWAYLRSSYLGSLPFDGVSVLNALNQAGVGLCLHREEHTYEGVPSMRIFETVASGAIAICGEHAFIRQQFKDTVLYLDNSLSTAEQIAQILDHLAWIKTHPEQTMEMSREAHRIFVDRFCLEALLTHLEPPHQNLLNDKGFVQHYELQSATDVKANSTQIILRTGDHDLSKVEKTLNSLQQQTYQNFSILLLKDQDRDELDSLISRSVNKISINVLTCDPQQHRSSDLWQGIQSLSTPYFGVVESGTILHPNHLYTLVQLLERFPDIQIAYSEVIQIQGNSLDGKEIVNSNPDFDRATLLAKQPTILSRSFPCCRFINLNSFLARSSLIDDFLQQDPHLMALEDVFLMLNLAARGSTLFSYEATCEIDASSSDPKGDRTIEHDTIQRIHRMMGDREFPSGITTDHLFIEQDPIQSQLRETEAQLQQTQQRVAAMETSKFWQLRKQWFQLKRRLGLNTANE